MSERIDPAVRLNMRIFKALDGMIGSRLATTIPFREVRQFAEAFLAADDALAETPALAQLGTGSGAGAQSDSGADSGHLARAVQSEGSTAREAKRDHDQIAPEPLERGKFHRFPADGDDPENFEWFASDIECGDCVDAVILRADDFDRLLAALAKVEAKEKTR